MAKIKAKASQLDMVIEQNASFSVLLTWLDSAGVPINVTGYSATLTAKDATGTIILTWTEALEITLGGTAGTISIDIDDSITNTYTFDELTYCLVLVDTVSFATRLLKGTMFLDATC